MITSLISGFPSRETWTHSFAFLLTFWFEPAPKLASVTSSLRRSVVDQTPTTAFAASAALTGCPLRVTCRSGICMTVEEVQ